jgi:hypothetical protein
MDVKARVQSNLVDIELCRQAIQAKHIRLALEAESPIERRIRELERSNALFKAIRDERMDDEPTELVRTRKVVVDPDRQYRNAFQRRLRQAHSENTAREHGHRQEYRQWWYRTVE